MASPEIAEEWITSEPGCNPTLTCTMGLGLMAELEEQFREQAKNLAGPPGGASLAPLPDSKLPVFLNRDTDTLMRQSGIEMNTADSKRCAFANWVNSKETLQQLLKFLEKHGTYEVDSVQPVFLCSSDIQDWPVGKLSRAIFRLHYVVSCQIVSRGEMK